MDRSFRLANWSARSKVGRRIRRPVEVVVATRGDALRLLRDPAQPRRIRLTEPLAIADRDALVRQINDELRACGCGQASAAMLIMLPTSAALAWWLLGSAHWGWVIAVGFVATGAVGALSKWAARGRANTRYRQALRQLADSFR